MASSKSSVINLIKRYIARLKENNISVEKVLLFGSYMNGTPREDSDIDIAVISSAFKGDRYSDRRLIVPLRRGIDSRIDPIPFTPEDYANGGMLIDEIRSTGQEILQFYPAQRLVDILSKHGRVLITTEGQLHDEFKKYQFPLPHLT